MSYVFTQLRASMTHHEQREERLREPILFSFSSELIVLWDLKMACGYYCIDKMNMCINIPEIYVALTPKSPGNPPKNPKAKSKKEEEGGKRNKLMIKSKHISLVFMYLHVHGFSSSAIARTEEYL